MRTEPRIVPSDSWEPGLWLGGMLWPLRAHKDRKEGRAKESKHKGKA